MPPSPANSQGYRSDIDGLRAVAVLFVMVFHIERSLLPGGFIGVDVFFVISGYLISLHIFRDLERGRFSLVEFYRRRVKRIAPVLLVLIAAIVLLTQFVFRPEDAEATAESGLWSVLSFANVYFWAHQDTSYFAAASNEKPLLHLWSLGVEEQFYLIWPVALMLLYTRRRARNFAVSLTVVSAVSFVLAQVLYRTYPSFSYYMMPTRAGELLLGAIVAQILMKRGNLAVSGRTSAAAALLGLSLIFSTAAFLSEESVFPGFWALPPTVGTAMLILAGHYGNSWPIRLLKLRPMLWVGMISYSAYLWHWPVLGFWRYGSLPITALSGSILFVLTLLLAWCSYRYVECPARDSTLPARQIFARQFFIPATALALVAGIAMKADGYGLRAVSPQYKANLEAVRSSVRGRTSMTMSARGNA